ncbi:hypothetical protein Tco_0360891 [Tanacetum coccineum]
MRISSMNIIMNLSKYGLHPRFMRSMNTVVLGQMTYLVASLTPDSARSYVMLGASFTQGTVFTIPFVGSISPEGFLPPILQLVVFIATVVVVVVVGGVLLIEKDGGTRIQACIRDELDNVVEEEDKGWICFLGGNNSSGTKKYRGSNSSDGGNTGEGVKIPDGEIGSGGGIDEMSSEAKEYLDKLSEGSGEMFPDEAGK